ncbi:MAG: hypothetical protein J0M15_05305 [Deltaproteobacteria bacterium]|nr:hypothetical protein [Deltaproteobacteria bacterium]
MFTESIQQIQQTYFKADTTHFNHNSETIHDIFQRCLNNSHHSSSPKIEVTCFLVPFGGVFAGRSYKFKLESNSKEYTLDLNKTHEGVAKKIEWEEVTVKGWLALVKELSRSGKFHLIATAKGSSLARFGDAGITEDENLWIRPLNVLL